MSSADMRRLPQRSTRREVSRSPQQLESSRRPGARPTRSRRAFLLLDLPIAWRLTIGFLLAAVIAAAASAVPALQRAQSLSRESAFYQSLLATNTSLTTGNSFLQLMNTEAHNLLTDASAPAPSRETLATDESAIAGLATRYNTILNDYVHGSLLDQNASQVAQLTEAGHAVEVTQQRTLASSALRTWQFYQAAQAEVVHDIATGDLTGAQTLERDQGEPTNADALSAVRALIQFDGRVASSIQDAAVVEQNNQIVIAAIAAVLAFLAIGFVGWIISNTLVSRLRALRRVTQLVESGQVEERVFVAGRDEIARVSASVNAMLDTIVGLLDVTRRQRDALTDAADRLFTDMRLAGAGDLRVNAAVSSDPIGMLANAFNFTIGRFRRFVLRTQTTLNQLDVVGHRELERAETFLIAAQQYVHGAQWAARSGVVAQQPQPQHHDSSTLRTAALPVVTERIDHARELVRVVARSGANHHARAVLDLSEQAYIAAGRLSELIASPARQAASTPVDAAFTPAILSELRTLGSLLQRVGIEANSIQQNTSVKLAELDGTLADIPTVLQTATRSPEISSSAASTVSAASFTATATATQMLDLVRLASTFAQDASSMARQVIGITDELRAGLLPFRLEAASPTERGEPALYAPGTGFGEPADYRSFGHIPGDVPPDAFYSRQSFPSR